FVGGNVAEIFDSTTARWSSTTLSVSLFRPGATTVGTKAFFTNAPAGAPSNVVVVYDAVTGRWSSVAALSQSRDGIVATSVGAKALFAGGYSDESATGDVYDDRPGEWSVSAPLAVPRDDMAATSVG